MNRRTWLPVALLTLPEVMAWEKIKYQAPRALRADAVFLEEVGQRAFTEGAIR